MTQPTYISDQPSGVKEVDDMLGWWVLALRLV